MDTVLIIILVVLLLILMEIWRCAHTLDKKKKTLVVKNLPDSFNGFKICHLADFHTTNFVEDESLIKHILLEKPDIICVTGDMLDCKDDVFANAFFSMIEYLDNEIPIYCSLGNHELRVGKGKSPKEFCKAIRASGVHLLDNQKQELEKNGEKISLYGYVQPLKEVKKGKSYMWARLRQNISCNDIEKAIGKSSDNINILLAHDPALFNSYCKWGANIVFSGHLHGGMVRIPFIGGLLSPNRTFFPKYDCGLFKKDNTQMYVTKGLGNGDFVRLLNPCEVTFLTLKKGM